jgi:hypothetical protein
MMRMHGSDIRENRGETVLGADILDSLHDRMIKDQPPECWGIDNGEQLIRVPLKVINRREI